MLRLIKFLFTGDMHLHEWEILGKGNLMQEGRVYGCYFHQKCKHCGKLKFVKNSV